MPEQEHITTCERCGEVIEYVWIRTRGYWTGITSGPTCNGNRYHHTPSPEYYRRPEEAPNA